MASTAPPFETRLPAVVVGEGPTPPAKTTPMYVSVPIGAWLRRLIDVHPETILHGVPYGDAVEVFGFDNSTGHRWARARHNGVDGWIRGDLLSATPPVPTTTPTEPPARVTFEGRDKWVRCIAFVRKWEGGWADDPNDPGGATNKGITIGTYAAWREAHGQPPPTKEDLRNISDEETDRIFFEWYWLPSGADKLPWPMCLAVVDLAVNGGVGRAREAFAAVGHNNFLAYMAWRLDWYTRISGWKHFGVAWARRVADLLREAAKHE